MSKLDELVEARTAHIKDGDLKAFYGGIYDDAYGSLRTGQKILNKTHDELAVLQGIGLCLDLIVEDLDEHGKENQELYDGHGTAYFKKKRTAVKKRISELKRKGAKSTVFETYQKRYDEYLEKADEGLDEAYVDSLGENTHSTVRNFLAHKLNQNNKDMMLDDAIDAFAAAALGGRKSEIESMLKALTPEMLESPKLLYNLSACYAVLGDKVQMLKTIRKAQAMHQFAAIEYLADEPFKKYWKDPAFLDAITGRPTSHR